MSDEKQDIAVHSCTSFSPLLLNVPVKMAHFQFSNVVIHGGTFSSMAAQGGFHVNNMDSESGMHDFRSVQISSLIDDPMKDFIP